MESVPKRCGLSQVCASKPVQSPKASAQECRLPSAAEAEQEGSSKISFWLVRVGKHTALWLFGSFTAAFQKMHPLLDDTQEEGLFCLAK